MKLNSIPAGAAAWAVGITTKNVIELTRRKILTGKRESIGERKHSYFYDWNEVCFLGVLVRFQKRFSIKYRDSLKWKKAIQEAMLKNVWLLMITGSGEVKKVDGTAEPRTLTAPIDIDAILPHDAVILLNIKKMRGELIRKLEEWEK